MLPTFVKVHCGSSHVKGRARSYPYYVASPFSARITKRKHIIYENKGLVCGPFRSYKKCERIAQEYCREMCVSGRRATAVYITSGLK